MGKWKIIKSVECEVEAEDREEAISLFSEGDFHNPQFDIQRIE